MPDHRLLPLELWLLILKKATSSEKDDDFIDASYTPFRPVPDDSPDPSIAVKAKVALVCRNWQALTLRFLYEDVKVSRGANALLDSLSQHANYGRMIRRLVLPYTETITVPYQNPTNPSLQILRLCANLETLVRPRLTFPSDGFQFQFETENNLSLSSLRRLDWWYHGEAERSGGINSLNSVLQSSQNLEYLSVGGAVGYSPVLLDRCPLTLDKLHTLRLYGTYGSNGIFLRILSSAWSLPALTDIIVDSPPIQMGLSPVWEAYGEQLRTVEFGRHLRFMLEDHISGCLRACPNLTELNFFLFFTMTPSDNLNRHPSIVQIGLHAAVNQLLDDGHKVCDHIENHFNSFLNDTFPALKKLNLYGEWRGIISHPRLARMWQELGERGIVAGPPVGFGS